MEYMNGVVVGNVFVVVLSFILLVYQLYSYKSKKVFDEFYTKYKGVISSYDNSTNYLLRLYTVLYSTIFVLTLYTVIFTHKRMDTLGDLTAIYSFVIWFILMLICEGVVYILVRNKYREYYE